MIKKPPLFSLEVAIIDNKCFEYTTQISKFEEVITNAIDHCINSLQEIKQIHIYVLDKLKWHYFPNIAAVGLDEPLVQKLRSRVQVSIFMCLFHIYRIFFEIKFIIINI